MWSNDVPKFRLLAVAILLGGAGCVLLAPFLFGDQILLYKDIGSDSINEEWPLFVLLSDYIRAVGIPSWSFQFGLGQSLYPYVGHLLFNPVVWLPRDAIPGALAWQYLLRIILSGLLFFRFLELRGLNFRGALGGALFLAFSGYLALGSGWSIAANELLIFTFVLFAAERALRRGPWVYLAMGVAFFGLISVFHLYLCALLLGGYVVLRSLEEPDPDGRKVLPRLASVAAIALLGIGLSAVVAFDLADAIAHSPRGSGTAGYFGTLAAQPIFGLASAQQFFTSIGRYFSTDLLGTGNDFRGSGNYFEAPATYCGLVSLLLVPQAVYFASRRQRWLICGVLTALIGPLFFPWFRHLFWAFQGDYYRAFSLFTVFALVTLSATALARYASDVKPSLALLGTTTVILIGTLWLPFGEMGALATPAFRWAATGALCGYAGMLALGFFLKRQTLFASLLLALSAVELVAFDRVTIAQRPTITKSEMLTRTGYNDHTVEAMRDLKDRDDGFYRVTKPYSSGAAEHGSLNDSMIFGYYGTAAYSSFNSLSYVRFLLALDLIASPPEEGETRWIRGLAERFVLSAFAGEKYVFTQGPMPAAEAGFYDFLAQDDDIFLYRNQLSLPIGLAYTRFLSEERFLRLTTPEKERGLLHFVVLNPAQAERTELDEPAEATLQQETALQSLLPGIERRRETAFQLRSFQPNHFAGNVNAASASMLVFQTPFDRGWRAELDGAPVPVREVDFGLIGVAVPSGIHDLELRYRPRFMLRGAAITLVSLLLLILAWRRWPRLS